MSKELYEQQAEAIEAIPNAVKPNIPISVALQEAEELHIWAQPDQAALEQVGLQWTLVQQLPRRAAACRYIETLWQSHLSTASDAEKEWKQKRSKASQLSIDLTRALRFAFRGKPNFLGRLKPMSGYLRHEALIDYYYNIASLATEHIELLRSVGFDVTRLDGACDDAEHLSRLLAQVRTEQREQYLLRDQRNKAYTYLKLAVDEVRRCGKFAFAQQPDRLKGYASSYWRKR